MGFPGPSNDYRKPYNKFSPVSNEGDYNNNFNFKLPFPARKDRNNKGKLRVVENDRATMPFCPPPTPPPKSDNLSFTPTRYPNINTFQSVSTQQDLDLIMIRKFDKGEEYLRYLNSSKNFENNPIINFFYEFLNNMNDNPSNYKMAKGFFINLIFNDIVKFLQNGGNYEK